MVTVQTLNRIKRGSQRIKGNILKVQASFRSFLHRKQRWCESASKQWILFEDQYLQAAFKVQPSQRSDDAQAEAESCSRQSSCRRPDEAESRQLLHQEVRQPLPRPDARSPSPCTETRQSTPHSEMRPSSRRLRNHLTSTRDIGLNDWRSYRVPAAQRRFTLGRWYMAQVRRWVATRDSWKAALAQALQQQVDIQNYMRLCGHESAPNRGCPQTPSAVGKDGLPEDGRRQRKGSAPEAQKQLLDCSIDNFLSLNEEENLDLIRLAVAELAERPPFMNHPARQGEPPKFGTNANGRLMRILRRRDVPSGRLVSIDSLEQMDFIRAAGEYHQSCTDVDESFLGRSAAWPRMVLA